MRMTGPRLLMKGPTVASFNVLALPSLLAWVDPSDTSTVFTDTGGSTLATTDGQAIQRINDKSGNGYFWTGTGTVKRGASGVNGLQVLAFASGKVLNAGTRPSGNGDKTVFLVSNPAATATSRTILDPSSAGGFQWAYNSNDTQQINKAGIAAIRTSASAATGLHTICAYATNVNSTAAGFYMDGVADGNNSSTASLNFNASVLNIGTNYGDGKLGEIIICSAVLSAANITATMAYLKSKWGTP